MAKQRYINTRFWDDGYITTLDPIEKLLFLYFLTNPLTEIAGAYEIPLRRVAFDTGIDKDMVTKILARFADEDRIIYRDGWILVCNFIKHQSTNPKMQIGIEKAVNACPDWVKDRLSIAYDSLSHLNLNKSNILKSNSIPIEQGDSMDIFEQEQIEDDFPISDLMTSFPDIEFTPAQLGHLVADISDTPLDREALAATLKLYTLNHDPARNSYMPTKMGTFLSVFKDEKKKIERDKNGKNKSKRTDQDVFAESADFYANYEQ